MRRDLIDQAVAGLLCGIAFSVALWTAVAVIGAL
jgi:hypothetical protein